MNRQNHGFGGSIRGIRDPGVKVKSLLLLWMLLSWVVPMKSYTEEIPDFLEPLVEEDKPLETSRLNGVFRGNAHEPPLEVLDAILISPDFGGEQEGWGIRFKEPKKSQETPQFNFNSAPGVEKIKLVFAAGLRIILIIVIVGIGVLSLWYLYKRNRNKKENFQYKKTYGIAPAPGESPESFLARSRSLYAQGQIREAWAACLAGSIAALSQYKGIHIPPGATEYDCLALVRGTLPGDADGFAGLLRHWIPLAYSGKAPEEGALQGSLRFCESLLDRRNHA